MLFKNFEGNPKRTVSTSGGLELLQIASEPDIERCASKGAEPQRGWTPSGVPMRTLALKGVGL